VSAGDAIAAARGSFTRWRQEHTSAIRQLRLYGFLFRRSFSSMLGLGLVAGFLLLAAIGPYAVPYPADISGALDLSQRLQPPSWHHLFGTDEMGADIFSRVIAATRTSLVIGLIITGAASAVGVPLGIIAAYRGGRVREAIMRLTDIFLSVPALVLALAIVAALGAGIVNGIIALSVVWWPGYVRLIEAKALAVKEELFVEAARSLGASRRRIIFRHLLPNCLSPLIVKASMDMGNAILAAASLGFIGLGAKPPAPEWGAMISVARTYMPTWWWYAFFPGAFIYLTVLGFNLFGDGLRDILDPKSNRG
jgi:peptide/nickel transport system permease protein